MKTSTSFTPGQRLTGRGRGAKNKKTMLKEEIGISNWDQIETFIVSEGASKFIESMRQLNPGQYVQAYVGLLEFFRPKLARQNITTDTGYEERTIRISMNLGGDPKLRLENETG